MQTIDPTKLLATDARLLTEDTEHIVVAVRLKKDLLDKNAAFFFALLQTLTVNNLAVPIAGSA